jgi:hypothetical protein
MRPVWLINKTVSNDEACLWRGLHLRVKAPSLLPQEIKKLGVVWEQIGEPEPLLRFALLKRVHLQQRPLKLICQVLGLRPWKLNGKLSKRSYATPIVHHVLPDQSEDMRAAIIDFLAGTPKKRTGEMEDVDVMASLEVLDQLDEENKREFSPLIEDYREALMAKLRDPRTVTTPPAERVHATPALLRSLLPGGGALAGAGVALTRNPVLNRYQGWYPGAQSKKT